MSNRIYSNIMKNVALKRKMSLISDIFLRFLLYIKKINFIILTMAELEWELKIMRKQKLQI